MAEPKQIAGLGDNEFVEAELLVLEKSVQTTKAGAAYLALVLGDAGGRIEGRVWDRAEELDPLFDSGDIIRVKGRVNSYRGQKQIVVNGLEPLPKEDLDLSLFMPAARRPEKEMLAQLDRLVGSLAEPFQALCRSIFSDPELRGLIRTAPAAKSVHHDFLGGLLEHTLSVAELTLLLVGKYPYLHQDLLLTGALLHDVGKALELTLNPGPDYTDVGRLVGHVVLGVNVLRDHLPQDFPPGLADEITHLILSHHGVLEFGSPKTPQTLEALALNFCDEIDAKLTATKALLDDTEGEWSPFNRLFERFFYKGSPERPEPAQEAAEPATPEPVKPAPKPKEPPREKPKDKDKADTPGLFGEG